MYTEESTFVKFDHISFQCLVIKLLIQELALSLFDIITKSPEHKGENANFDLNCNESR